MEIIKEKHIHFSRTCISADEFMYFRGVQLEYSGNALLLNGAFRLGHVIAVRGDDNKMTGDILFLGPSGERARCASCGNMIDATEVACHYLPVTLWR